jgi:hypothetical protein
MSAHTTRRPDTRRCQSVQARRVHLEVGQRDNDDRWIVKLPLARLNGALPPYGFGEKRVAWLTLVTLTTLSA